MILNLGFATWRRRFHPERATRHTGSPHRSGFLRTASLDLMTRLETALLGHEIGGFGIRARRNSAATGRAPRVGGLNRHRAQYKTHRYTYRVLLSDAERPVPL
jgi:hypothetical protein